MGRWSEFHGVPFLNIGPSLAHHPLTRGQQCGYARMSTQSFDTDNWESEGWAWHIF
jgi:hypothetical protein